MTSHTMAVTLRSENDAETAIRVVGLLPSVLCPARMRQGWFAIVEADIAAIARRGGVDADAYPPKLRLLPVSPKQRFETLEEVRTAMRAIREGFHAAWAEQSELAELRVSVTRRPGRGPDAAGSQAEARVIAKLAKTVTDLACRTGMTPPALCAPAAGERLLALSILVPGERLTECAETLDLAQRLADAQQLDLHLAGPGPIRSFALSHWGELDMG
ncbi:MAG: hypothetical protein AAGE76_03920 [Pseudomonadota bacterium]